MSELLSSKMRHYYWHRILITVARHQEKAGIIPEGVATRLEVAGIPKPQLIGRYEAKYQHDVAGFVGAASSGIDPAFKPYVYFGMTSSDLVDTANAMIQQESTDFIMAEVIDLINSLGSRFGQDGDQVIGRTHGQHAAPTRQNAWLDRALSELGGWRTNADRALKFRGKLSGPVGQYSPAITKPLENDILRDLDVSRDVWSSQIVRRTDYARFAFELIQLISICESIAMRIRLSALEGIGEMWEPRAKDARSSSSMPHKINPLRSERICGLARVARGLLHPILETHGAMWFERDISNSSVERTALVDIIALAHYITRETCQVVATLQMDRELMQHRAEAAPDTASALRSMVLGGANRDDAYEQLAGRDQ